MGGIISGFLDGAGRAAATSGRMFLADQIAQEREEANYLRDKELKNSKQAFMTSERMASQEFKSAENQKNRDSKIESAKLKRKSGGKPTNQEKNIKFLMSAEGGNKPLTEAITLAFPSSKIKHTDEEGNQIVVVPSGGNKFTEVGRIVTDEKGKQQWLNKGEQLENAEITSKHRKTAKKTAKDKASYIFTGDDFPSTGGDRKEFTKKEAQRLANEERAAKKGGGIISGSMKGKSDMTLPGGEVIKNPSTSTKVIQGKSIGKDEYIKSMLKKYPGKRKQIESQWNSY